MKFTELLRIHISRRIPAIILAVLLCALFSLYYFGLFDLSFVERPESWSENLNMFAEIFLPHKDDAKKDPASNIKDEVLENDDAPSSDSSDNKPSQGTENDSEGDKKPSGSTNPGYQALTFLTVGEMKEQGYTLTDKIYDESCVFARLDTPYDLPTSFTYGFKAYDKNVVTTYTDGTESTVETIRISKERLAIELYMGYIIYDDNGTLYIIGPDGSVLTTYNDNEYVPAYTRDLQGRPLFYKYVTETVEYPTLLGEEDEDGNRPWEETKEMKVRLKEYYYLDEDGKTFEKSDYNDKTDNRGLYFDYPSYYGRTDSEFSRYYLNTTKYFTDLKGNTTILDLVCWTFSKDEKMDISLFNFDKYGILANDEEEEEENEDEKKENEEADEEKEEKEPIELPETLPIKKKEEDKEDKEENTEKTEPDPITRDELFPYTMAYNFVGGYATVLMDIDWTYDHDMENDGIDEMKTYDVTTNELRVIDDEGKIMFESRKVFFSELGWMASEKYTTPLVKDISSLGSYYFDHGYMRVRLVSWDCYHQAQFDQIKIVTDEDILIDPNGKRFDMPSGYKLVAYSDGILLLEKDGKYGYMNTSGNWVRDPDMDDAQPFIEGVAVCKNIEGQYGLIDTDGNTIIPFSYDYISNISSGTIAAYDKYNGWTIYQKLTIEG